MLDPLPPPPCNRGTGDVRSKATGTDAAKMTSVKYRALLWLRQSNVVLVLTIKRVPTVLILGYIIIYPCMIDYARCFNLIYIMCGVLSMIYYYYATWF